MNYDWDFSVFAPYAGAFLRGTGVTVLLATISSMAGTMVGVPMGAALRVRGLNRVIVPANDVVRAVPMLVLMFFFYYFPYRDIFGLPPASEFVSALLALTLAQAVFTADLVRAAVDGVSRQTVLGAKALGLSEGTIWWHIILPDVVRQILPSLLAFYIGNIKLSSLASVIGCRELVFAARVAMGDTFRSLEAWMLVAAVYVALVLPLGWGARVLERSSWLKRRS